MMANQITDSELIQFPRGARVRSAPAEQRVNSYPSQGVTITERLRALDTEWDIDQVLAAAGVGLSLGLLLFGSRRCQRLVALGFALPLFGFRRASARGSRMRLLKLLRLRTRAEIEAEKFALQVIRGDFDGIADELHRRACAMNVLRSTA